MKVDRKLGRERWPGWLKRGRRMVRRASVDPARGKNI